MKKSDSFKLEERVRLFREGGRVKRLHTRAIIGENLNATHSWNVAILIWILYPSASKNLILAALTHDLPEYWTGDVPAPAKWEDPDLAKALERVERKYSETLGISFSLTDWERRVLEACDKLELLLFAEEQLKLGNRGMSGVKSRVEQWFSENKRVVPSHILQFLGLPFSVEN